MVTYRSISVNIADQTAQKDLVHFNENVHCHEELAKRSSIHLQDIAIEIKNQWLLSNNSDGPVAGFLPTHTLRMSLDSGQSKKLRVDLLEATTTIS